jgi:ubiquinone/menaquinone biosynthesis C-methylase UbiE
VQEVGGKTEVAAVDPVASMLAIQNDKLAAVATKVREELKAVIESL